MYLFKIFKKIISAIIIFVVCGITYNFFTDAFYRITVPSGKEKVYLISIYNGISLIENGTSYIEPEIFSNCIKYLDLDGNTNMYCDFKIVVIETTEDNNNL
jgi:hypothetical protein